ncbi:hypothetical protein BPO_1113 [Bergeyella porcorum]|uniref:Uncharacterized protein n=1 Tax=Bergeyella porcorum TaxID=1735111 RepID=A0AAU0F206_9FLAO
MFKGGFENPETKLAKKIYPNVDTIDEAQKIQQFKTNGSNGAAILLYEFANGKGADIRNFHYDFDITQQFLANNRIAEIKNEFFVQLSKKGLTYNQFIDNNVMVRGGYSFSPDHTTIIDSAEKHVKANFVQFVVGGANIEFYPDNDYGWINVIIWNPMSRNSFLLHQADSYQRDGSGNNLPLSTIRQNFIFKLKVL